MSENKKALKDLINGLVKVAKVNDKYPNHTKLKENSIRIVMNKIFENTTIYESFDAMSDVEIQLITLYDLATQEKGILGYFRIMAYKMLAFDNIVKILGMSTDK